MHQKTGNDIYSVKNLREDDSDSQPMAEMTLGRRAQMSATGVSVKL